MNTTGHINDRAYVCPDCDGGGEVYMLHSRYGSYDCPYEGDDEQCESCFGTGSVVLDRLTDDTEGLERAHVPESDPLLILRANRDCAKRIQKGQVILPWSAGKRGLYQAARMALRAPSPLPELAA